MRYYIFTFLFVLIAVCSTLNAQRTSSTIYAFAYGTSLENPNQVYVSAVEVLAGATINKETKFLEDRNSYSNRFKHYLDTKLGGLPHTCTLFYDTKRSTVEKMFLKMRKQSKNHKEMQLTEIPTSDFSLSH